MILGEEPRIEPVLSPLVDGVGLHPNKGGKMMSVERFNAIVVGAIDLYEEGWRTSHAGGLVGMEGSD